MSAQLDELRGKLQALRQSLSVAMVAADELMDTLESNDKRGVPATGVERRQVAALRKLLGQPHVDGVAMTRAQAEHEVAHWTAEAERRQPTAEQRRALGELAAALTLDGIAVDIPERLSLAGYVREWRRLKSLRAEHQPSVGG